MVSRWSSLVSCFSAASLIINKAQIIYSTFKKTHYFAFASEGCLSVGNTMVCRSSFSSLNTGWDHPGASCLRDIWKHSPLKFTATTVRQGQVDLPHLQWSESVFRITLLGRAGAGGKKLITVSVWGVSYVGCDLLTLITSVCGMKQCSVKAGDRANELDFWIMVHI